MAWYDRFFAGRRRHEPQRDTALYPRLMSIGGQAYTRDRPLVKPTPANLRRFAKTTYARRAIKTVKDPIVTMDWEIAPKEGVDLNPELQRQIDIASACFAKPNRDDSFSSLVEVIVEDMIIGGAGVIEHQLGGDAIRPLWIWPVDVLSIQIFAGWDGDNAKPRYWQALGYGNVGGSRGRPLLNSELTYIKVDPSTETPFGLGAIEVAFATINRLLGTQQYAGDVATNATPKSLMFFKGMSGTDLDKVRAYWTAEVEGQGKRPIFGGPDDVKVADLRGDDDDSLFLKFQELLVREIFAAVGVSPQNAGIEKDVNRNCYSEDTETLTARGWKRLDEIVDGDLIAAFNPASRAIEFCLPDLLHVADYSGDMIHISGHMTDTLVTPDHRMWARRLGRGEGSKVSGGDYQIMEAAELESGRFAVVASLDVEPRDRIETFVLPGCELGGGVRKRYPERCIPMDDWLAFLGFHISEGHAGRHGAGTWKVNLCQNEGTPTCAEMDALVERLPFAFAINKTSDGCRRWQVADKALCSWIIENCGAGAHSKRIPSFVFGLPQQQMRIVFDALMKGDGTRSKAPGRKSGAYYTASVQLRDDVQLLATQLGHRAVATANPTMGVYRVKITYDTAENEIKGSRNVRRVPYAGRVYCFSVSPHHLFVTRRNGKIAMHGNTAEVAEDRDWRMTIVPMAKRVSMYLNREVLEEKLGFTQVEFKWIGLDRDDEEASADIYKTRYTNNMITPNEERGRLNMPPSDNPFADLLYADMQIAVQAARGAAQVDDDKLPTSSTPPAAKPPKPKSKDR